MNREDHNKRIDRLVLKLAECGAIDPVVLSSATIKIMRGLIDDALADAYGSGEADERKRVVDFLRICETDNVPESSYSGVTGRKVREFVLETAREFVEAGKHDQENP